MRENSRRGRRLRLADGSCWGLTAEHDAAAWLHRLSAIMELSDCTFNGEPGIMFRKMEPASCEVNGITMPAYKSVSAGDPGWVCYDYGTIRIWTHDGGHDAACEVAISDSRFSKYMNMWRSLQPIYQRSLSLGGMPFHAALAELERRAVILAGWSGRGKSTCSRRFPDYWKPLCDDETLIVSDGQKEYQAHPLPTWSHYIGGRRGKTWNVQYSVPLSAIFFLEQAEKDEAIPVGQGKAAALINESASQVCRRFWPKVDREIQMQFRRELFNNACKMAQKIPAFRLRVSLDGRFWEEIEKALERV